MKIRNFLLLLSNSSGITYACFLMSILNMIHRHKCSTKYLSLSGNDAM